MLASPSKLHFCELNSELSVCVKYDTKFCVFTEYYAVHTKPNTVIDIMSPGFPNYPYPQNTFAQWQLRADPGYVIRLDFTTFKLEENCKNDFVKVYDSLVAIESRLMAE